MAVADVRVKPGIYALERTLIFTPADSGTPQAPVTWIGENGAVISGGAPGPHKIQGIGPGFIPDTFDSAVPDEVITVSNEDAFAESAKFAVNEGVFVGISAGAALKAASDLAKKPENKGKTIVALLPDSGDRYLSTDLVKSE